MINSQEILLNRSIEVTDSVKECLADLIDNGYEVSIHQIDAGIRDISIGRPHYSDPRYNYNQCNQRGLWVIRITKPNLRNNRFNDIEVMQRQIQNLLDNNIDNVNMEEEELSIHGQFLPIKIDELSNNLSFFISYIQDSIDFEVNRIQSYVEGNIGRPHQDMSFCVDRYDSSNYMVEPYYWKHGRNWISALYSEMGRRGVYTWDRHASHVKCIEVFLSDVKLSHIFHIRELEIKSKPTPPPIVYRRENWFRRLFKKVFW